MDKDIWFNQGGWGIPNLNKGNTGPNLTLPLVACNSCQNGSPVGVGMFPQGQCPPGSSQSHNPCSNQTPQSITCYACSNGQPLGSSYINMTTCPTGETTDPNLACAVSGCTDSTASNYNPAATISDNSCTYPNVMVPCKKCGPLNTVLTSSFIDNCPNVGGWIPAGINTPDPCAGLSVAGCTDPLATNYNPLATQDDGNCMYQPGCTDPIALNHDPAAIVDDGSCNYAYSPAQLPGCTDPTATNYNSQANSDDGTCTYTTSPLPGCTDPLAENYTPLANTNDGSCVYISNPPQLGGCMYPSAGNYNPAATYDDGSCVMAPITPTPVVPTPVVPTLPTTPIAPVISTGGSDKNDKLLMYLGIGLIAVMLLKQK